MTQRLTEYGCGFTNLYQLSDLMTDLFSFLCTAGAGVYFLLVGAELLVHVLQNVGMVHYNLAFECRHSCLLKSIIKQDSILRSKFVVRILKSYQWA